MGRPIANSKKGLSTLKPNKPSNPFCFVTKLASNVDFVAVHEVFAEARTKERTISAASFWPGNAENVAVRCCVALLHWRANAI